MSESVSMTKEELAALVSGAVKAELVKAGVVGRPAPQAGSPHVTCTACGHRGIPTDDGRCPNNNCPRHEDAGIYAKHPTTGAPVGSKEEYEQALESHAAVSA